MSRHIRFDGFDCRHLIYVKGGDCWVCLDKCLELDDVEFCFKCKFARQLRNEERIRRGRDGGRLLRLAQDAVI